MSDLSQIPSDQLIQMLQEHHDNIVGSPDLSAPSQTQSFQATPDLSRPPSNINPPDDSGLEPKPTTVLGSVNNAVRAVADGITFGQANKLSAATSDILGGKPYSEALDAQNMNDRDFASNMPVTATIMKLMGMTASPITRSIGTAVNAVRAPGLVNNVIQNGMIGGLFGAGDADPGHTVDGAVTGTLLGATGGAAMHGIVSTVGAGIRGIADRMVAPASAFARRLESALTRDGLSVDDAQAKVNAMGPNGTIADLGKNTRGLAEASATQPGKSLSAAEDLTASRSQDRSQRLVDAALNAAGASHIDELAAKRSVEAAPYYEAAFNSPTGPITTSSKQVTSPFIERLLADPYGKQGLNAGMRSLQSDAVLTGEPIKSEDFALSRNPDSGQFEVVGTPNMRMLDAVKRGLDSMLSGDTYRVASTGKLNAEGVKIDAMRRTLLNNLDDLSPIDPKTGVSFYKQARDIWSGYTGPMEALTHVQKVADAARDGSDITGRLFGSNAARAKLKALFPDQASEDQFRTAVQREKLFADTERKLTGNSRTAYRNAAQDDATNGDAVDAAFSFAKNPTWANAVLQSGKAVKNWVTAPPVSIADEATPLYSTDPAVKDAAFNLLRDRASSGSLFARTTRPYSQNLLSNAARVGGLSGGLLGSNQ